MNFDNQVKKAKMFHEIHNEGMFLLPNAWNGGSAKIFEKQGFSAVGTTSAGIAYAMGYSDGENIDFDHIVRVTKEIMDVIDIPLTVDLERGYSEDKLQLVENVRKIIELGAVGINIEDGQVENNQVDEIELFCEKIKEISNLKESMGIPFVLNARTDVFLIEKSTKEELIEKTLHRAKLMAESGADCIFIPGAFDMDVVSKLRRSIGIPINLYVHSAYSEIDELRSLGINRLSSGSGISRTSLDNIIKTSSDFYKSNSATMLNHEFTYGRANDFFGS